MSPAATQGVVAGIEVRLGGQALEPKVLQKLIEVRIQENLMLPDSFLMRISDPDMKQVDSSVYEIGAEVEILLASAHEGTLQPVFKGQVTALEPEFSSGGAYVALRGYDNSHAMHRTKRTQTYQNVTAGDVAEKVASRSGLTLGTIDPSGAPHDFVQQSNESDWEFLWRLAGAIDFEVVVLDKELHFREAGGMADAEPVTLAWGAQLVSFRPRVTGVQQMHEVLVRGWDPSTKQVIEATGHGGLAQLHDRNRTRRCGAVAWRRHDDGRRPAGDDAGRGRSARQQRRGAPRQRVRRGRRLLPRRPAHPRGLQSEGRKGRRTLLRDLLSLRGHPHLPRREGL